MSPLNEASHANRALSPIGFAHLHSPHLTGDYESIRDPKGTEQCWYFQGAFGVQGLPTRDTLVSTLA